MTTLNYVYDARYLDWNLGEDHPTNPVRALNAMRLIGAMGVDHRVETPRSVTYDETLLVHEPAYLTRLLTGECEDVWEGRQPRLATTAMLMAGGTMTAVDRILAGEWTLAFNPQGAKHHAHADHGSGFCAVNDMAIAAKRFTAEGMRVAYLDWDVHHGDGVEALLRNDPNCLTASVHGTGFPGSGYADEPANEVWNVVLNDNAPSMDWIDGVDALLASVDAFEPDVILLAAGADAHRTDPLGSQRVCVEDYAWAAGALADCAMLDRKPGNYRPVLVGGAGGYQPHDWTPLVWATVARVLSENL